MSKGGKIALWSLVGITIAGVATFVALKWDGFVGIIKGEQTYSHAEVLEIEEKAYQKGLSKQNEYEIEIKDYKSKIEDLTVKVNNLTESGVVDKNTITELNAQIIELSEQLANSEEDNEELQAEIDELTLKIQEYQSILEQIELGNRVAVTFVYDGQIYGDSMVVDKGTTITLTEPEDTDYIKFNYWHIDGDTTPLTGEVTVEDNMRIVADLTYYQKATFVVGDTTTHKFVQRNVGFRYGNPSIDGYVFEGWYVDGEKVNLGPNTMVSISEDTVFTAKLTKLHTVTYNYMNGVGDFVKSTETVKDNTKLTIPGFEKRAGYTLLGYTINGTDIIDTDNYVVTGDIELTAKYSVEFYNKYSAIYRSDNSVYAVNLQYNSDKDTWTVEIAYGTTFALTKPSMFMTILEPTEVKIITGELSSTMLLLQAEIGDFSFSFCLEDSKTITNLEDVYSFTYFTSADGTTTDLMLDYCKNNEITLFE